MIYDDIRKELTQYYFEQLPDMVEDIRVRVFQEMDAFDAAHPNASSYFLKAKLYDVIADNVKPQIFENIPLCFEFGSLLPFSDGRYNRGGEHASGWLFHRNMHIYEDFDKENYAAYMQLRQFFAQCGTYSDFIHLGIPMKKLFKIGLSGILKELAEALPKCTTEKEREFILCATAGIKALHKMAIKLSSAAAQKGMTELAELAARVPFEAPRTFQEGLSTLAFMRKALGTLEGYGFSSMGRPDVLLAPLYEKDLANGMSHAQMLDLVSRFLLIWDCTNDRRVIFEKGFEYEMENTITLGGCDDEGNPVYNGVTELFITARDSLRCIFPKMMLRFSENSPEEYLHLISKSLTQGKSYSLFENDDAMIPALLNCGTNLKDARGYIVGGCWDALTPDTNNKFSGEYFFLTKPFLMLMTPDGGNLKDFGFKYTVFEKATSFQELYESYIGVIRQILYKKAALQNYGSQVWDSFCPASTLSALMECCIDMRKDMTAGGIKYSRESVYYTYFGDIVDSLYAIKRLCFDDQVCTIQELIDQCIRDWPNEALRQKAIALPSYGDGSEEATSFAGKFFDDLCEIGESIPTAYGGKCRPGFNVYTEIVYMGNETAALPNGRKAGDYLSQGITPSRLKSGNSLYDLLDSVRYMDFKKVSGNASITLSLPAGKLDEVQMAALFRVIARNGLQGIQPNCINKEELIAAKADPENHRDIIVRVCGFSAPFVCLSSKYQDEIIARSITDC